MIVKESVLQVNFESHVITDNTGMVLTLRDNVWRDLESKIDPFWHTESDRIEFFFYYNTGEYLCQKEKLVYDFSSKAQVWKTYLFTEASQEKAEELYNLFSVYLFVEKDMKTEEFNAVMNQIEAEDKYYDGLYTARKQEKKSMLSQSDWRVLPDIVDDNKDMWLKWRDTIRNEEIKSAKDFENNLEYFRYLVAFKWPMDPLMYLKKYPDGKKNYLSSEDHLVSSPLEASTDLVNANLLRIMSYLDGTSDLENTMSKKLYDLAEQLKLKQVFPGLDLEKYTLVEE
jgi:hypothetical protein